LSTHKHLYEEGGNEESKSKKLADQEAGGTVSTLHNEKSVESITPAHAAEEEEEEEEDELGFYNALFWLGAITVLIALLSDAISASIQDAADSAGISGVFISAIILPIVGNAAEHAGAVMFAMKGKLDLSLGVAIGSSTQIALCVLPLLVIIGWMIDQDMTLNFGGYESTTLLVSVISVTFAIKDGQSNWLVGATLIGAYIVISIGFWAHVNEPLDS
jgi:Ca2+:H+ antiporter